jgi:hypothetical protein
MARIVVNNLWPPLLNNDGEVEWQRDYGEGSCYAVIELKSGEFMLAGITGDTAQLIKIDNDGDVIWQETYQHNENRLFNSMRETEGGVVASGNRAVWVIKVDEKMMVGLSGQKIITQIL